MAQTDHIMDNQKIINVKKKSKIMATLRKYETVTDINVYEVNLTDEQLKMYQEDEEKFFDEYGDELDWEFSYDKVGDPDTEFELKED